MLQTDQRARATNATAPRLVQGDREAETGTSHSRPPHHQPGGVEVGGVARGDVAIALPKRHVAGSQRGITGQFVARRLGNWPDPHQR